MWVLGKKECEERSRMLEREVDWLRKDLNRTNEIVGLLLTQLNLQLDKQPEKLILKPKDEKTK